jgi:presenilin-like A22 family membrane protease
MAATQTMLYPVAPFSEDTLGFLGSFGNAIYFVVLVFVGATLLYFLMKRKNYKIITIVTTFALTTAIFMLSFVYLFITLSIVDVSYATEITLTVSIIITTLADYAIFRTSKLANIFILGIGGALGTFLGSTIPTASTVLILSFLAIYDTFAVYRGPVGKIARSGLDQFRGLSYSFRDMQMGLGDLTFYSMLSGHMFLNFGSVPCLVSIIGVLVGCILSFFMLEKKGVFPGLPFPILFGLTAGLLVSLF